MEHDNNGERQSLFLLQLLPNVKQADRGLHHCPFFTAKWCKNATRFSPFISSFFIASILRSARVEPCLWINNWQLVPSFCLSSLHMSLTKQDMAEEGSDVLVDMDRTRTCWGTPMLSMISKHIWLNKGLLRNDWRQTAYNSVLENLQKKKQESFRLELQLMHYSKLHSRVIGKWTWTYGLTSASYL